MLGGASWARLGSDGVLQGLLKEQGVAVAPLLPANVGFLANWGDYFTERFAGQPLKAIAAAPLGDFDMRPGECMVTADGIEGGLIYAWSAHLREAVLAEGSAVLRSALLDRKSTRLNSS